jgi:four helix bundle protein
MSFKDFKEMPVWSLGQSIVIEVYALTEKLPSREDYALCGQFRRASLSITGNIAEGFGRGHAIDKVNFYYFSRGSAYEVKGHLLSGEAVNYFNKEETKKIHEKSDQLIGELNKIIKSLINNSKKSQPQPQSQS